jgi:hypothetical protein
MITEIGQRSNHTRYSDRIKMDFWNIIIESKLIVSLLKTRTERKQLKRHIKKIHEYNMY